ncbi:MAG: NosD domain-containing protein [Candidatus Bathyarchaeia archaeon]
MHKKLIAALFVVTLLCLVLFVLVYTGFFSNQNNVDFSDKIAQASIVVPDDYENISLAIANAKSGDFIFVRSGVYKDSVTVDKPVTLQGQNSENTIVDGNSGGDPSFLVKSDNVTIIGFKARISEDGFVTSDSRGRVACIHLLSVNNCNITGNTLVNSGKGVWIYQGSQNQIVANQFFSNNYGVLVESSNANMIIDNKLHDGWCGILLDSSINNTLRGNELSSNVCGLSIDGTTFQSFSSNTVDNSNTNDGKKVYYLINQKGITIDPASYPDVGLLILVNCREVTIENLILHDGLQVFFTNDCEFTNNTVTDSNGGILLFNSHNCRIVNNTLKHNQNFGICLKASNNALVKANFLEQNNSKMIALAISNNNTVTQNIFHASGFMLPIGIDLEFSKNNQIINNSQAGNGNLDGRIKGVNLVNSPNNAVQYNDFSNVYCAVLLQGNSNSNQVDSNNFSTYFGDYGIQIFNSTNNMITHNALDNFEIGFNFYNSENNTITENSVSYKLKPAESFNSNENIDNNQFTKLPYDH